MHFLTTFTQKKNFRSIKQFCLLCERAPFSFEVVRFRSTSEGKNILGGKMGEINGNARQGDSKSAKNEL